MSLNTIAILKLLNVCRALREQAYHGRSFIKIDPALFERFSKAVVGFDDHTPTDAHETAELIVRDFIAANRTDDDAQAALADWIADSIVLATLDLSETVEHLRRVAQRVLDHWESGDLAGAVRELATALSATAGDHQHETPA